MEVARLVEYPRVVWFHEKNPIVCIWAFILILPRGQSFLQEVVCVRSVTSFAQKENSNFKMANPLLAALQRDQVDDMLSKKLGPLKPALSHIGLYMGIVVFTAAGAKVSTTYWAFTSRNLTFSTHEISFLILTYNYIMILSL